MLATHSLLLAATASLATAHFGLKYPSWRADALTNTSVTGFSEWTYPCAGVATTATTNRTAWPLTGGSLVLDLHHPWTYVFVNLGLGPNVTNFNYTLTPQFLNTTGNGTLCIQKLALPSTLNVTDGATGSLQVVTLGDSGSALYSVSFPNLFLSSVILDEAGWASSVNPGGAV